MESDITETNRKNIAEALREPSIVEKNISVYLDYIHESGESIITEDFVLEMLDQLSKCERNRSIINPAYLRASGPYLP